MKKIIKQENTLFNQEKKKVVNKSKIQNIQFTEKSFVNKRLDCFWVEKDVLSILF